MKSHRTVRKTSRSVARHNASRRGVESLEGRYVTAEDVGAYKPDHAHFERFFEVTTADKAHHVHVAASLFHDVAPANELGLKTVWISRGGADSFAHTADATPDAELVDLAGLPDALDELVPA